VEVGINLKNEVMFYLIKDDVYSDLYSGSGFEKTAAALALRAVLGDLSTIPKLDGVTYDEVWGRVSKDNYENMERLINKIAKSFNWVFLISHNQEIYDMCNNHILVTKENNISKINLK
jgi:DNA repair exonuclease SbcCD ATPase subunit